MDSRDRAAPILPASLGSSEDRVRDCWGDSSPSRSSRLRSSQPAGASCDAADRRHQQPGPARVRRLRSPACRRLREIIGNEEGDFALVPCSGDDAGELGPETMQGARAPGEQNQVLDPVDCQAQCVHNAGR